MTNPSPEHLTRAAEEWRRSHPRHYLAHNNQAVLDRASQLAEASGSVPAATWPAPEGPTKPQTGPLAAVLRCAERGDDLVRHLTQCQVRAIVDHSADGTLVRGTSREDRAIAQLLRQHGFRWSRNLEAWYLPRTWTEITREQRVQALEASELSDHIDVRRTTTKRRSAAEREDDRRDRAAARANHLDERAEKAEHRAEAADRDCRRIQDGIPLGQPVLLGHHSQRRHERDLERIDRGFRRAVEARADADRHRAAADRARTVSDGHESVVTIGNRIERTAAEIRRTTRNLETATGTYRDRLQRQLDELQDQLDHDHRKLDAAGGIPHSRETVHPGDLVRIRGTWYPVVRSNPKTVTVPSAMADAESRWTNTTPWHEVQQHLPRREATREQVAQLVRSVSPAFPGLRHRLASIAAELPRGAGES